MIPGKIFTGFAKFHGIVSVNDFRLPIRLQEFLQAPLCLLRSFCFARIRLDPLGGQVLHHDCISMIVSRFIHNLHWEFCDLMLSSHHNFSARGTTSPVRLLHEALVNLVLWQISPFRVFREVNINTVFCPIPLFSAAPMIVHEKNSRVSLCVQELFQPQDSLWILAAIPVSRKWRVSHRACLSAFSQSIVAGLSVKSVLSCNDDV